MGDLQSLMRYKRWTNQLVFEAAATLTDEQLNQPHPIVFGSLLRTLNHTLAMDEAWRANLLGENHGMDTRWPLDCPPLSQISEQQEAIDQWFLNYVEGASESDLNQEVSFRFIGGGPGTMSRRDILLHVINHGTYHRGHVTGMMYEFGIMPPTTDYPVFLKSDQAL